MQNAADVFLRSMTYDLKTTPLFKRVMRHAHIARKLHFRIKILIYLVTEQEISVEVLKFSGIFIYTHVTLLYILFHFTWTFLGTIILSGGASGISDSAVGLIDDGLLDGCTAGNVQLVIPFRTICQINNETIIMTKETFQVCNDNSENNEAVKVDKVASNTTKKINKRSEDDDGGDTKKDIKSVKENMSHMAKTPKYTFQIVAEKVYSIWFQLNNSSKFSDEIYLDFRTVYGYYGYLSPIEWPLLLAAYGTIFFGKMISSLKDSAARVLVIIAALGFGIVKPRLGKTLYYVLVLGAVYFIASFVHSMAEYNRVSNVKNEVMAILLAAINTGVCYWILTSLMNTMRTLRLRRNPVKLSLYKHFTYVLVFAMLISLIILLWTVILRRSMSCIQNWQIWVHEAISPFIFIYAYSPLADEADDDMEEQMVNEAFGELKDDPLKWVEDNIPKSLKSAIPVIDSEEEVETTLFEINKMH
ncbi:hypothetical protein HELRODRAFT_159466 [Helobdella robusta]|uniref:GOST seven transmembrane domain-containing protein n=1 Tax=Helobdella robusta TaxID=6412 RepID=T1EP24_HELRO|nr:hypothetical protein HELRODRAFT_159466 [Helobdella robusta]ESO12877.1 hypothetical protein HELRODRAFT_159466 [Helobdella robusta]